MNGLSMHNKLFLAYTLKGYTIKEIAEDTQLHPESVASSIKRAMKKIKAKNRAQLGYKVYQDGLWGNAEFLRLLDTVPERD